MANEVNIPVPGAVSARPLGDTAAEWEKVADTPGRFTVEPGRAYSFSFVYVEASGDADLIGLCDALAGGASATAITTVELHGCEFSDRAVARLAALPWLEALTSHRLTDTARERSPSCRTCAD